MTYPPDGARAGALQANPDDLAPWRRRLDGIVVGAVDRAVGRLVAHWLLLVNVGVALVLAGAVAAPLLRAAGLEAAARAIHELYLWLCPQRLDHSYFLFGDKLALEQRELAMFGAQLVGGVLYGRARGRVRRLDWRLVLLFTLPVASDGFSQTFGWRGSTWLLRTLTGGLFNLALVLWLYPLVDRVPRFGWRAEAV